MKEFIRKIWDAFVTLVNKVPKDKLLHFVMGLLIAAFCALVLNWGPWCILPAIAFGALKELFDWWTTEVVEWWDFVATSIGGLIILVFVLVCLLI